LEFFNTIIIKIISVSDRGLFYFIFLGPTIPEGPVPTTPESSVPSIPEGGDDGDDDDDK